MSDEDNAISQMNTIIDSYNGYNYEVITKGLQTKIEIVEDMKRLEGK